MQLNSATIHLGRAQRKNRQNHPISQFLLPWKELNYLLSLLLPEEHSNQPVSSCWMWSFPLGCWCVLARTLRYGDVLRINLNNSAIAFSGTAASTIKNLRGKQICLSKLWVDKVHLHWTTLSRWRGVLSDI